MDGNIDQNSKNSLPNIKLNYFYNTIYQVLTMITPLITAPYISRVLGVENVGIQSYTKSIVTYFTLFAALGTASYGQREIAMHRNEKYNRSKLFWEIELLSIVSTIAAICIWLIWTFCANKYNIFYLILTFEILSVAFDISWLFMGLEQFKSIVIRNSAVKVGGIIFIFAFVREQNDLLKYVIIMTLSGLAGNIATWTYLPKTINMVPIRELNPFQHFKQTISYFIPTIAISIYTVLDKTMIGAITASEVQNGNYEQAQKIVRIAQNFIISLNIVMSSRMSYLFSKSEISEIKGKLEKSFGLLFLVAIPSMFGLIGISGNFVPWFFGLGYEGVIILLCILSPLPWITCISNTLGNQYLTPSGQRVRSTKGILLGALTNGIVNFIMIPRYGAMGAAIGTVIAESIISIAYIYMSKGFVSLKMLWEKSWRRLIAAVMMLFAIYFIGRGYTGKILITMMQILFGTSIYFAILFLFKDADFMQLIEELLSRIMKRKKCTNWR